MDLFPSSVQWLSNDHELLCPWRRKANEIHFLPFQMESDGSESLVWTAAYQNNTKSGDPKKYQCNICFNSYAIPTSLSRHMRIHRENALKCLHCGKIYQQRKHLNTHIETCPHRSWYWLKSILSICQITAKRNYFDHDAAKLMWTFRTVPDGIWRKNTSCLDSDISGFYCS